MVRVGVVSGTLFLDKQTTEKVETNAQVPHHRRSYHCCYQRSSRGCDLHCPGGCRSVGFP